MGHGHSAGADSHNGQSAHNGSAQAQGSHHGSHDTGSGGNGNSGGTLCGLEDSGQQEGEENAQVHQEACILGDVADHGSGRDDLAQNAASSGNEQDGANSLQSIIGDAVEVAHLLGGSQLDDTEDGADSQRWQADGGF